MESYFKQASNRASNNEFATSSKDIIPDTIIEIDPSSDILWSTDPTLKPTLASASNTPVCFSVTPCSITDTMYIFCRGFRGFFIYIDI